jgi:hypothetical protein
MALKKNLSDEEKYGLTEEEIKLATKWLRKYKTAGALKDIEAVKLFEMFLLGDSIPKIAQQFPQYTVGQIALTAALRGWVKDREKAMHTLQDRVRAKVVKSVLEQVDFLTSMMAVANAEHMEAMARYIQDPMNNPKPSLRVTSIKEYKDVAETLYKIVAGATPSGSKDKPKSPMFEALSPNKKAEELEDDEDDKPLSITAVAEHAELSPVKGE